MDRFIQENIPLLVFGLNHRTACVEIREQASLDEQECASIIKEFKADNPECGIIIISTCNRTEIYISGKTAREKITDLRKKIDALKNIEVFCRDEITYLYQGEKAVEHFFRVISSLDSQMVGEPQITGQVKQAYENALSLMATDTTLNKLYHFGMQAEKQVRNNTYLTDGAVSVSFAGVELARKIYSNLQNKVVLLIGAGETAELAAVHFLKRGVSDFIVVNRTHQKAQKLAGKFKGEAIPIENLSSALAKSDIVISATSSKEYVVDSGMLKDVMKERTYKSIFFIDIAIPRDIDPAINKLDGVYLYDMDSLQEIVDKNVEKRKSEIPKAEKLVHNNVSAYVQWYNDLPVTDTITKLSSFFEEIREKEYQRLKKRFPEENHPEVEYLTKSLMKKFLHLHISTLRDNNNHKHKREQHIKLLSEMYQNGENKD